MRLLLPEVLRREVWRHARAEAPRECVGVLGGRQEGETWAAQTLYPLPNIDPAPERAYLADPGHLLRAWRAMQAEGLDLVALYHSHPRGPAGPSATDQALAAYPVPYLIADLSTGTLRAYLLPGGEEVGVEE
ncbi:MULTISPECIES: Mov34/MPN/PAD-1 family protein [Deinococcus]|uniref:Mov34/MPN/PAD-1 family protein n=1 Tax=Deinococcus TaxID=1298 RepID=UPI001C83E7C5|nr:MULTISPECIES: M67 family metallopeptidase [Deinococcus]MBZ9712075.1 M67 family metallopeptidase [Deinococcus multiflagellatus]